jgi:hypothetical protein
MEPAGKSQSASFNPLGQLEPIIGAATARILSLVLVQSIRSRICSLHHFAAWRLTRYIMVAWGSAGAAVSGASNAEHSVQAAGEDSTGLESGSSRREIESTSAGIGSGEANRTRVIIPFIKTI